MLIPTISVRVHVQVFLRIWLSLAGEKRSGEGLNCMITCPANQSSSPTQCVWKTGQAELLRWSPEGA